MSARSDYVKTLEDLTALMKSVPNLPAPTHISPASRRIDWLLFGDENTYPEQKALAAKIVKLLPGHKAKRVTADLFRFAGEVNGLKYQIVVQRDAVCERIVTGKETVTTHVPDPEAVVPMVEVTEEVETVEWKCSPLLDDVAVSA